MKSNVMLIFESMTLGPTMVSFAMPRSARGGSSCLTGCLHLVFVLFQYGALRMLVVIHNISQLAVIMDGPMVMRAPQP